MRKVLLLVIGALAACETPNEPRRVWPTKFHLQEVDGVGVPVWRDDCACAIARGHVRMYNGEFMDSLYYFVNDIRQKQGRVGTYTVQGDSVIFTTGDLRYAGHVQGYTLTVVWDGVAYWYENFDR